MLSCPLPLFVVSVGDGLGGGDCLRRGEGDKYESVRTSVSKAYDPLVLLLID